MIVIKKICYVCGDVFYDFSKSKTRLYCSDKCKREQEYLVRFLRNRYKTKYQEDTKDNEA